jgi:hypothetical protein
MDTPRYLYCSMHVFVREEGMDGWVGGSEGVEGGGLVWRGRGKGCEGEDSEVKGTEAYEKQR